MTAQMSDVMAMAGEALAWSALVHLHRVGVLFLAVIGQERARASASCGCALPRRHWAGTRSCICIVCVFFLAFIGQERARACASHALCADALVLIHCRHWASN
jgi:hypothetical protein